MAEGKINYDYPLPNLDQRCHQAIYSIRGDADYKIDETYDSLIRYAENLKGIGDDAGVHHLVQMVPSTVDYQFE